MAVLVSASLTFVFYLQPNFEQISPEYHLCGFLFRHTLENEFNWVVCIEYWRTVSTDGFFAKSISDNFFSIHSYPLFDFSEILGVLCPGSSIWFYLHHIDFRTGRRSPKCCWCFIAASLSQGVFATTEILTFTSKHWKKSIVFFLINLLYSDPVFRNMENHVR